MMEDRGQKADDRRQKISISDLTHRSLGGFGFRELKHIGGYCHDEKKKGTHFNLLLFVDSHGMDSGAW
jgi:hypothetical protein